MEPNHERTLILRPSHELAVRQTAPSRILDEMVASTLMLTKGVVPEKVNLDDLVRQAKQCRDLRFAFGEPPEKTPENVQAFSLLHEAGSAGHPEAQYLVSHCYHNGIGVGKNLDKTLEWLVKSAEAGFAAAQCSLGNCYYYKYIVPHDSVEALKWYQSAAEQDYGFAQDCLGGFYLQGIGVTQNLIQAYKWLKLADEKGVGLLIDSALKLAVPLMTPSEIETAEALYSEFKNRRGSENYNPKT